MARLSILAILFREVTKEKRTVNTANDVAFLRQPVLIVGGSLIGLSTSLFLSWHGIPSLLVERHPGTAIHPRVASLTARTMEIFRSIGVESAIREIEPSFSRDSNVPLVESLTGQEFDCLMEDMSAYFTEASPVTGSLIAQDVLEPVLRAQAERAGGELRYGTELIAFEQHEQGIRATLRERATSSTFTVEASFLVAADGSKSGIRQQLDISQHGAGTLSHLVSMIFEADLLEELHKREAIMCYLSNDLISGGALVPYPGSAARTDLFRLDVVYDPEEETLQDYPEERCLALIRAAVGIPDLPVRLKTVLSWDMAARVSDQFQRDRVFLVGDAARVQPPTGALGGNTGIAEAHNLAWKLAAVIRGAAGIQLLTTYEQERRDIANMTVEQVTMLSQQRQNEGSAGITVDTLTVNMGYRYQEGTIIPESKKELPNMQSPLNWNGEPGTRAPHFVLNCETKQHSTLDLFGRAWVLLLGSEGQDWQQAAQQVAQQLDISLDVYLIDAQTDTNGSFSSAYGMSPTGAVIVRPDGFVAWRAGNLEAHPRQALEHVFCRLLFRQS